MQGEWTAPGSFSRTLTLYQQAAAGASWPLGIESFARIFGAIVLVLGLQNRHAKRWQPLDPSTPIRWGKSGRAEFCMSGRGGVPDHELVILAYPAQCWQKSVQSHRHVRRVSSWMSHNFFKPNHERLSRSVTAPSPAVQCAICPPSPAAKSMLGAGTLGETARLTAMYPASSRYM